MLRSFCLWLPAALLCLLGIPALAQSPASPLSTSPGGPPGAPYLVAETAPALEVEGLVTWSGRRPAEGVRAELVPWLPADEAGRRRLAGETHPPPVAHTLTDSQGRYRLVAPSPGVWRLRLSIEGAVPLQFIPLVVVQPMELPPAALSPARRVRGQVQDAQGRPMAGAWVFIQDAGAPRRGRNASPWRDDFRVFESDAEGRFELLAAPLEVLDLTAFPPFGDRRWSSTRQRGYYGGAVRLPPVEAEHLLRLEDAGGGPVPDALVRVGDLAWPAGRTDAQGRLALPLPSLSSAGPAADAPTETSTDAAAAPSRPGGVAVQASLPDGRLLRHRLSQEAEEQASSTLVLPSAKEVQGRVTDSAGRPLVGAVVRPGNDPGAFVLTDADGRYLLQVPTEVEQWVQAEAAGHVPRRGSLPLALLAAGRGPGLALEPAAALAGEVVDGTGQPVVGAHVAAVHRPLRRPRPFSGPDPADDRSSSTARGGFGLARLQPGERYTLLVWRPGVPVVQATAVAPAAGAKGPKLRVVLPVAGGSYGRVLGPDRKPLAGVEVRLAASGLSAHRLGMIAQREGSPDDPFRAVTGADGRFRTAAVPATEIDVVLQAPGFVPLTVRGVETAGSGGESSPRDLGTFYLQPGVELQGLVVDEEDQPVAGAEIYVLDEELAYRAVRAGARVLDLQRRPATRTDEAGRFVVPDLAVGSRRTLWARGAGYLPASAEGVEAPTEEPVRIVLERAAGVAGRVVDEEGAPIAGAGVTLKWQRKGVDGQPLGSGEVRDVTTGEAGRFFVDAEPERPAQLVVEATGYVDPEPLRLVTPPVGETEEVELVLGRGATVKGTVATESGQPVAEARVSVGGASAFTDGEGVYGLEGARVGATAARVVHRSYGRLSRDFEVEAGENTLDWKLPDGRRVSGRVLDSYRQGIAGAEVVLTAVDGEEPWEHLALTDADGGFSLQPVPTGRYALEASAVGYAAARVEQPVTVAETAVEDLEVILRSGTTVQGRVLGLDFGETADVQVVAHGLNGAERQGQVDYEGSYRVADLEPGSWLVVASLPGRRRQAQERVRASVDRRSVERDLIFGGGVELSGVLRLDGEPLAGANLSLRGETTAVRRSIVTDHRGEFRFADLDPGSYRLGVHHAIEEILYNEMVEVEEDRYLDIDLRPITVAGLVLDGASGEPLEQVVVSLERLTAGSGMVAGGTGADGRFVLRRVPPGRYRLTARRDGWASAQREIQLAQGQELSDLELVLEPTAGLTLAVSRADGSPPPYVEVLLLDASGQPLVVTRRSPDAQGLVRLPAAPPGIGALLVQGPGGALWHRVVAVPAPEPEAVILQAAGALALQVPALADSNVIAFATLTAPSGRPLETLDLVERGLRRRWPLVGGAGVVEGVPAGEWRVQVEAPDGAVWSVSLVTTGGAASVVLP